METTPVQMPSTEQQSPSSDDEIEAVENTASSHEHVNAPIAPL